MLPLILEDLLACLIAVEDWHLKVHDYDSIAAVFALRIGAARIFVALFEHLECLLAITGFVDANLSLMNDFGLHGFPLDRERRDDIVVKFRLLEVANVVRADAHVI